MKQDVQRAVRKVQDHLPTSEYRTLYPSGSAPGKFYGTVKKHKIPLNGTDDGLPLRPTISNKSYSKTFSQNAVTIEQIRVHSQ